jgi:hypothetical protein
VRLALAAIVLTVLLPTAAAFVNVGVSVAPFDRPVKPSAPPVAREVDLSIPCDELSGDGQLALNVSGFPAYANASVAPSTLAVSRAACAGGQWSGHASLSVAFSAEAPALVSVTLQVAAQLAARNDTGSGLAGVPVVVGYDGSLQVTSTQTRMSGPPGGVVTFPFSVVNRGNGLTRVVFTANASDGFRAVAPPQLVLPAGVDGNASASLGLSVVLPANRATGSVTLHVTSASAADPALTGDSTDLAFTAVSRAAGLPAPGVAAAIPLLALAALARGRKR